MPELPEVETIMLGITPFLEGATITKVKLNRSDLRWPFPENFAKRLEKAKVLNLKRRSKYILVNLSTGETLLIHLGMSGKITQAHINSRGGVAKGNASTAVLR